MSFMSGILPLLKSSSAYFLCFPPQASTAFVMFPVQIITTVDSHVVQLDYLDGRLLISSLTRSYLCDTER